MGHNQSRYSQGGSSGLILMSKTKAKRLYVEDRRYQDGGNTDFQHVRQEKTRNKRKERRIEHALKTKNIDELLDVEENEDY